MLHQLINAGSLVWVLLDHRLNDAHEVIRVHGWDAIELPRFNLHCQLIMRCSLKWGAKSCHLVYDASCAPYVTLFVILLVIDLLWGHVVWGANMGIGKV